MNLTDFQPLIEILHDAITTCNSWAMITKNRLTELARMKAQLTMLKSPGVNLLSRDGNSQTGDMMLGIGRLAWK